MPLYDLGKHARTPFVYGPGFTGLLRTDEPMSNHTTYRIGGPARYYIEVGTIADLKRVLLDCRITATKWTVVGQGSNLLVSDEGYDGAVIVLKGIFKEWIYDEEALRFTVGAGANLARVVQEAFHQGVSGLEFAVGTPGTVGGALRMNAGSAADWIGSRVVTVSTYCEKKGITVYNGDQIEWSYRRSSIPRDEVITECVISVEKGIPRRIREKMDTALARRKDSQPMGKPSCGSVFRNPEGYSAGALIEGAGLKGRTCGGACISEKHANFIVNTGDATAMDVLKLIRLAQDKVEQDYGIELHPEVRFLGFE